jgi:hypothetical protein
MIADIITIINNIGNGLYNGIDIIIKSINIFIIFSCDGIGVVAGEEAAIVIKK